VPAAGLGFFAGAFTTLLLRVEPRPGTDALLGVAGFLGAFAIVFGLLRGVPQGFSVGQLFVVPFVAAVMLPVLAAVLRIRS
jgi:hypothetical protein